MRAENQAEFKSIAPGKERTKEMASSFVDCIEFLESAQRTTLTVAADVRRPASLKGTGIDPTNFSAFSFASFARGGSSVPQSRRKKMPHAKGAKEESEKCVFIWLSLRLCVSAVKNSVAFVGSTSLGPRRFPPPYVGGYECLITALTYETLSAVTQEFTAAVRLD